MSPRCGNDRPNPLGPGGRGFSLADVACVVVAEDNLDNQRVIAEVVRRLGHQVIVTGDGQAALKAIAEHRPSLVVADVDMPHLNGLEMCRAIRHDPEIAGTPVV